MSGLITYMKHMFGAYNSDIDPRDDPFHPFSHEEWSQQTSTMLRTYLIQNLPNPNGPEPVPSGSIPSCRPTGYSPAALELMGFKKGIKREIAAYPSLKDERYFDGFKRSLLNACVRYIKTKKANIGKRRYVYATNIDETYIDPPTACIDHVLDSPYGGIDLPPDEFYQVHTLSSKHPPSPRPGQPSRPSFRPQSQHSGPTKPIRRYDGPIFRPPQIYKVLSQDAMKALKAYNTEAITRGRSTILKLWKHLRMTLLGPQ